MLQPKGVESATPDEARSSPVLRTRPSKTLLLILGSVNRRVVALILRANGTYGGTRKYASWNGPALLVACIRGRIPTPTRTSTLDPFPLLGIVNNLDRGRTVAVKVSLNPTIRPEITICYILYPRLATVWKRIIGWFPVRLRYHHFGQSLLILRGSIHMPVLSLESRFGL
jgi:hypothetical protein